MRCNLLLLPFPVVRVKVRLIANHAIANHLHDHVDHVSIRQSHWLAGEAAVPYSVRLL